MGKAFKYDDYQNIDSIDGAVANGNIIYPILDVLAKASAKLQTMNINIDQQMISKIELNKRQVTDYELACICKCLKVTPNDILNFSEIKLD